MPVPLCNVTMIFEGREARVDDLWAELGVVGEADGKGKYERRTKPAAEVHWEEKQRREWLDEIGFEVARWGTREVAGDGRPMKRRVDRAIDKQAQIGFRWPGGVRAELRGLVGVTPPERVAAEVGRLRVTRVPSLYRRAGLVASTRRTGVTLDAGRPGRFHAIATWSATTEEIGTVLRRIRRENRPQLFTRLRCGGATANLRSGRALRLQ